MNIVSQLFRQYQHPCNVMVRSIVSWEMAKLCVADDKGQKIVVSFLSDWIEL